MNQSFDILRHYMSARYRRQPHDRTALERWQMQRFHDFSHRVLAKSPFYAGYVGKALPDYPLVDKSVMVAAFDWINTKGLRRDDILALAAASERTRDFSTMLDEISVGLSSGTSGNRGLFATAPEERAQYIGVALAKCLSGSILARHRIALLLRSNNELYETVGRSGRLSYRFFDLIKPVEEIVRELGAYAPTVVIGPPQSLRLLAESHRAGRGTLTAQRIFSCAEVLDEADRAAIEQAFQVPVGQIYQATEGFLGVTCRFGTLHLNEDYVHFEKRWIDRGRRRFMPIVTDFSRSTQPIVRYCLDDILVEREGPCPCGSIHTGISRVEGRFDDILALPARDRNRLTPIFPDFVRDRLAHCHDVLRDYRVIQTDPRRIEVATEGQEEAFAMARDCLIEVFERFDVTQPVIEPAGPIVRDALRKVRRVERRFPIALEDLWHAS